MKKEKTSKISKIIPAIIGGLLMSFVFRSCHNNNWLGTKEPSISDKIENLKKFTTVDLTRSIKEFYSFLK